MTHSLEEATGLAFRFVIGRTNDKSKMAELRKEVAEYDDFMLLDIEEEYSKLPFKTLVLALCNLPFLSSYSLFSRIALNCVSAGWLSSKLPTHFLTLSFM